MAYEWQLDVCEALELGRDSIVIVGTGSGKTTPFILPLLSDTTKLKKVLIISPLNVLEVDQAKQFKALGLSAVAVNGRTWNQELKQVSISE